MGIKKIIREEIDDFDWVRDIEPDLTDYFIPGNKYRMGLLHKRPDPRGIYTYIRFDEECPMIQHSDYATRDGALYFTVDNEQDASSYYSIEFIEVRLKETNLTLNDLVMDTPNLNESFYDDFSWADDIKFDVPDEIVHKLLNKTVEVCREVKLDTAKGGGTAYTLVLNDGRVLDASMSDGAQMFNSLDEWKSSNLTYPIEGKELPENVLNIIKKELPFVVSGWWIDFDHE